VRNDIKNIIPPVLPKNKKKRTVYETICDLPKIRSGLSKEKDNPLKWKKKIQVYLNRKRWLNSANKKELGGPEVSALLVDILNAISAPPDGRGGEYLKKKVSVKFKEKWFLDHRIKGVCNHSSRGHIVKDLQRYLYASCFAQIHINSPAIVQFPKDLYPKQGNNFTDRFRVQVNEKPATTVTSHISKDGHYYIHPDPFQCRSLTVREAARLQTFPDNYFFEGPRTQQYKQVGNAVPPLLARDIAYIVYDILKRAGKV